MRLPTRKLTTRVTAVMAAVTRVLACLALLAAATPAAADESPNPPRHLAPYGLDWINYIDPADLPLTRPAVCIVDSGVAITPDTPPDNPAGPIVARLSTDNGSGEPQGTAPEQLHGTRMAMAAIAPANGWGTIGEATWARAFVVRALETDRVTFPADAYRLGLQKCLDATVTVGPVAAVSFSLNAVGPIPEAEQVRLRDAIGRALRKDVSIVAAAGNDPSMPTGEPAAEAGVIAVSAGDERGGLCPYATFDSRVDLVGPACPIDGADPLSGDSVFDDTGGSSESCVLVATLVSVLRTLRPDASQASVEQWIRSSGRIVDGRRVLDGDAAARAAGLGPIVDRARARMPVATATSTPLATPSAKPAAAGTSTPIDQPMASVKPAAQSATPGPHIALSPTHRALNARARWHLGRLVVRLRAPPHARLRVLLETAATRSPRQRRLLLRFRRRLVVHANLPPDRISLRYVPATEFGAGQARSVILYRTASGYYRS